MLLVAWFLKKNLFPFVKNTRVLHGTWLQAIDHPPLLRLPIITYHVIAQL
jgi:hypothetical protein